MPRLTYVSIGLPPDIVSKIDSIATGRKTSRAQVTRELVERALSIPTDGGLPKDALREIIIEVVREELHREGKGKLDRDELNQSKPGMPIAPMPSDCRALLESILRELDRGMEPALSDFGRAREVGARLKKCGIKTGEKMIGGQRKTRVLASEKEKLRALLGRHGLSP